MEQKKILIIDDEAGFTEMVKLNLEATGLYTVIIENDATAALNKIVEYNPDLILLDVIMPENEGPDIIRQIREQNLSREIPIIFLTATVTREEVQEQDGKIGGHTFLAKPGSIEELMQCIERETAVS